MSTLRILRAQFEAEEHMAWQALHLPACSYPARPAASHSQVLPVSAPAARAAAASAENIPSLPIAPAPDIPAYPGEDTPSLPIAPAPDIPAYPGEDTPSLPIAPAPDIPAYPGDDVPTFPIAPVPGIPVYPGPEANRTCWVRFLHAAVGYDPLRILVGSRVFSSSLSYANMTEYRLVRDGFRDVVITSAAGARPILLRRDIPFRAGDRITVAIIDTDDGLELMQIPDVPCQNQMGGCGSMRMVNLAFNSPPLDMRLYDGSIIFGDVRYREVTPFKPVRCGDYLFYLIRTSPCAEPEPHSVPYEPLVSFGIDVRPRTTYTCYVLGRVGVPGQLLQLLVAEDD